MRLAGGTWEKTANSTSDDKELDGLVVVPVERHDEVHAVLLSHGIVGV